MHKLTHNGSVNRLAGQKNAENPKGGKRKVHDRRVGEIYTQLVRRLAHRLIPHLLTGLPT